MTSDENQSLKSGVGKKNLAVFVSGGGSNFRAVHQAILSGDVDGQFVVLVINKHDCGGAQYARDNGICVMIFPNTLNEPEGLSSNDLVAALSMYKIDFILLAGYLKLIPSKLIRAYPNSILNIHPSLLLLLEAKGIMVQRFIELLLLLEPSNCNALFPTWISKLAYNSMISKVFYFSGYLKRYSGPTIHFVDENYDMGRILAQRIVPVLANDTAEELAARVCFTI